MSARRASSRRFTTLDALATMSQRRPAGRHRNDKAARRTSRAAFHFLESGMPHVILRYRLPDEQPEFNAAMQGREAKAVIWAVDQHCRNILKYGEPN